MRLILKIFAVPLLLVLMFVCLLGNLATNFSGLVFTLFLFLLIFCAVICVIQSLWSQLLILAAMGFIAFVALVFIIWVLTTIEAWAEHLRDFIWS